MSSDNCPELPPPTKEEQQNAVRDMCQAAGIKSCQTESETLAAKGSADFLGIADASFSITGSKSKVIGCEQLVALSEKFRQIQNNISCIINNSTSVVKDTTTAINNIFIRSKGKGSVVNMRCDGGSINISQGIAIKKVTKLTLSDDDISKVASQVKTFTQDFVKIVQDNNEGLGSTAKDGKTLEEKLTELENTDYSKVVNNVLKKIEISMEAGNTIVIEAIDGAIMNITGSQCKITQNIQIDIMSSMILSTALAQVFQDTTEVINKVSDEIKQKDSGAGVDVLDKDFWAGIMKNRSLRVIGVVLMVIIFVIVGGFIIYKLGMSPAGQQAITKTTGPKMKFGGKKKYYK